MKFLASILAFIFIIDCKSMEVNLNVPNYDLTCKMDYGFYPNGKDVVKKNIEIINQNLNERADRLNLNNDEFDQLKNDLIKEFIDQAVQGTCLEEIDRDYIMELLLEDNRLTRLHPFLEKEIELIDEVDQQDAQPQGPNLTFAAFYQMMLNQSETLVGQKAWVSNNLELLFNTKPTLENIITILRFIGVRAALDTELVLDIKKKSVEDKDIIKTAQNLRDLFGEIIPNGFNTNEDYFERNSLLFLSSAFRTFLTHPNRTRHDFNELRALLLNIRLHPEFEPNRPNLTTRLNLEIPNLIINVQKMTLEKLRLRVINLYKEVRPVINENSFTKYYLVRQNTKNIHLHQGRVEEGTCSLCFDDFTNEDCGYQCTSNHTPENPHVPCHMDDLEESILSAIRNKAFPVTCGNIRDHQHELPIDLEKLKNRNILDEGQIQQFEFGTLLAYHNALLRLKDEIIDQRYVKYCATGGCETLLFAQDKNDQNFVRCPKCDIQRCFECDQYAHPGVTCEQNDINIENIRNGHVVPLDSPLRPCPYCLVVGEKIIGCNQIECESCGNEFNIQHGKPRRTTTFNQLHFGGVYEEPRKYLVAGEPGYAKELESNYPVEQGEIKPDRRDKN